MVQDVAAPVSIIVIALDVVSRPDVPPVVGADFAHFVGLLGSVGAVGTEAGSFSVTVSLEPDYEVTGRSIDLPGSSPTLKRKVSRIVCAR